MYALFSNYRWVLYLYSSFKCCIFIFNFSSRSKVDCIQHPNRRIYVDVTCFRPSFDLETSKFGSVADVHTTWSDIFLQVPRWVFNERFEFQVAFDEAEQRTASWRKVTTSILFSITKFCSAAYTDASVGGCGACFVTISESELLAFSIPHVPSIGVFGQGVFVYHGFAVQLAPWFIYSARAVPPEVLGFSTYAHSWCITHRLNAVQKLLG